MADIVTASFHKNRRTTLERIEKYISDVYFTDANLRGKLYPSSKPIEKIWHWALPGGEGKWEKFPFSSIVGQNFTPTKVGESFGPTWSTHWFKLEVMIPENWMGQEVWLRWKSQSEAMVWSESGSPLQGLSTGVEKQMRSGYRISECWKPTERRLPLVYYIEMSCNNMFGAGKNGMINPPDENKTFTLEMAEICTLDKQVRKLLLDLDVLHGMAKKLEEDPRGYEALYCANQMINYIVNGNKSLASRIADNFFAKRNGERAHTLAVMGHCHIDSAWLWPYSETKRKCARSWSSTLQLMKDYPEMKFVCSQAQQFEWVKMYYPELYARIKIRVQEGRFIPVGGTWVEMDGLIPSGESFMRQFLYGQRFFQKEFGLKCKEFWLPDTFGYSAQFPQICKLFGINRFLTQKLSWNLVNRFPHHNFLWEGLDGSTVLAHFPPGDSYEMDVTVDEAVRTVKNLEDKGRVTTSAFLYGFGDGGGGPTSDMLERARRLSDVDGCPRMEHMSPSEFFQRLEKDQRNLCRWVGELYLELHNGTYTSQAKTKKQNRECEFALREAEMLLAVTTIRGLLRNSEGYRYQAELGEAWKKVLLNQFHDVIPGSSIGIVYRDSDVLYQEALKFAKGIKNFCLDVLCKGNSSEGENEMSVINTLPWPVKKVINVSKEILEEPSQKRIRLEEETMQPASTGGHYVAVKAQGIGYSKLNVTHAAPVEVGFKDNKFILRNSFIEAVITRYGTVENLRLAGGDARDVFAVDHQDGVKYGNKINLYDDIPLYWDAWDTMDYHLETEQHLNHEGVQLVQEMEIVESGPLLVKLRWHMKISEHSSLRQDIELTAVNPYLTFNTYVDWHEKHKFLKVSFDTGLHAKKATFDSQFGHVERPTHSNTTWDSAKFEVCGHKWADISEHNFGVAVLNDSKYGWTCKGSKLSLSLLRSPKAPDDKCDMGAHTFKYALMPHDGSFQKAQVQKKAYEFNTDLIVTPSQSLNVKADTWFNLEGEGAMIEAVKLSEDNGNVVVRIYEMNGGRSTVRLRITAHPPPASAQLCNGLEEPIAPLVLVKSHPSSGTEAYVCDLHLTPFKIVNVLLIYARQ
ncbi:alpha-mannosidase 2C1-like [Palaemon carinicauda]|uniref:alpha-mannosidase 2C1-like n=1 Tax=Palaemon carinicauda TaxID=392227 RepID=UPI0035B62A26